MGTLRAMVPLRTLAQSMAVAPSSTATAIGLNPIVRPEFQQNNIFTDRLREPL